MSLLANQESWEDARVPRHPNISNIAKSLLDKDGEGGVKALLSLELANKFKSTIAIVWI